MMNDLIQADIFFFVATIGFGILTIFLVIILVYIVKILANVRILSEKAKVESDFIASETHRLFARWNSRRLGFLSILAFFRHIFARYF